MWICLNILNIICPVGWGCRIHRQHLCRGVKTPPDECPGFAAKQSDGKAPVLLKLWGIRRILSLPLLRGSLRPGVVTPDRALLMG